MQYLKSYPYTKFFDCLSLADSLNINVYNINFKRCSNGIQTAIKDVPFSRVVVSLQKNWSLHSINHHTKTNFKLKLFCLFLYFTLIPCIYFCNFLISSNAQQSWSGQLVPLLPHCVPLSRAITSSACMPFTSFPIPFRLPLQPPINDTFSMMLSSLTVRSIIRLHVPFVL